jgi:hypothetical protein
MNPYVFFVGCQRSGTTLLRRIGDAHPQLAILRELHWLPGWWERRIALTREGMLTPEFLARLRKHSHFSRLELDPDVVRGVAEERPPKHYARFISELFDLHGRGKGKRLVGEKTPRYVRHLPTLTQLWPHSKVVHLIRDGRDVALSLLDWSRDDRGGGRFPTWNEDPLTTAAHVWEWNVRLGREAGAPLGPERYYELRYEALTADPELECAKLCSFLGVPYDPAMLRFHEGQMRSRNRGPRLPVTAGLRRWREQLEPSAIARFEAASGDLLKELGYELASPYASVEELERTRRLRDAFVDHVRSRGDNVPERWAYRAA